MSVQSLLCGPSLSVDSVLPLLERLSEETLWGFSLHLLCATRRGQYDSSIERLLDRCPQAIIAYANHQLQDKNMVRCGLICFYQLSLIRCFELPVCVWSSQALWWKKLLPELCNRTRAAADNSILLAALKGRNSPQKTPGTFLLSEATVTFSHIYYYMFLNLYIQLGHFF